MRDVCADFGGEMAEFYGESEHVHLLVNFPPTIAITRPASPSKACILPQVAPGIPDLRQRYRRLQRLWPGPTSPGPSAALPPPAPVHPAAEPPRPARSHPAGYATGSKADSAAAFLVAPESR